MAASKPSKEGTVHKQPPVIEGQAHISFPEKVFYNPVQQFNRDMSVLGIRAWADLFRESKHKELHLGPDPKPDPDKEPNTKKPKILESRFVKIVEALSATGLRAIRYSKEIDSVKSVVANDSSSSAVQLISENVLSNSCSRVDINHGDANVLLHTLSAKGKVHVVDLDPYGSATPFIDAAVQAVVNDGLLLVTCTDLGVLAGQSHPEKCFAQYGGTGLSSDACHEAALRLVLHMIASSAARQGLAISPLLSLSIDFYVRIFVQVKRSPYQVKFNASKTMIVLHCAGCGAFSTELMGKVARRASGVRFGWANVVCASTPCVHCNSPLRLCGPMWAGDLHDQAFVDRMIHLHKSLHCETYGTLNRMLGMLTLVQAELQTPTNSYFYVSPPSLASVVKVSCPPLRDFVNALLNAGYTAVPTHAKPGCIKTNAPFSVLWDVMRAWANTSNCGRVSKHLKPESPGSYILAGKSQQQISFDENPGVHAFDAMHDANLVRYQVNPTPNWGPKARPR